MFTATIGGSSRPFQPATSQQQSTGLFSSTATAPSAAVPVVASVLPLTRQSKYNDCPDQVQKRLDQFHKLINDQKHLAESLDIQFTAESIQQLAIELQSVQRKFTSVQNVLERDQHVVHHLKTRIIKELDNEEMAARLFDAMMKHGGPGAVGVAERPFYHRDDYIWKYFCDVVQSLEQKVGQYQQALEEVERLLGGMMTAVGKWSGSGAARTLSPQVAFGIIKNNYDTFLALTGRVASLHDSIERQKELYIQWRRRAASGGADQSLDSIFEELGEKPVKSATFMEMASRITEKPAQQPSTGVATAGTALGSSMGGGLFGAQKPATGGGLFGTTTATTAPAGGGMFGGTMGGGLFGAQKPATTTGTGGLFGIQTTSTGGGMFGTQQQTSATTGGGLFGTQSTTQSTTGGGLFGNQPATTTTGGGLFGTQTSTGQTSGGLFGTQTSTTQPQAGGLFGTQQASQPGGMFGSQQAGGTAGGGLFGQQQQQASGQTAGGMFGQTQQPSAAGGGLFGATAQSQQSGGFGSTQPTASQPLSGFGTQASSFGAFGQQQQQQPQQQGGLFGATTQQQQPQQQGGLFGATTQQQQPQQQGGLFGANTQQQQQPSGGFFGSAQPQQQQQASGFGGATMFGQPQQQQAGLFGATSNTTTPAGGMFGAKPSFSFGK